MCRVEDVILTKHPEGKTGVNISKAKYNVIKASILQCLERKELTFTDLAKCVGDKLQGTFDGSIPWYTQVVKLDLEARGIIERTPKTKPQLYRTKKSSHG